MFKKLERVFLAIVILLISIIAMSSCGKEPTGVYTDLLIDSFINEKGIYTYTVPSTQDSLNFADFVTSSPNSSWKISKNSNFDDNLDANLSLKVGDNLFYVKVEDKYSNSQIYRINVIRRDNFTITFDSNGGTPCVSQSIDSGNVLVNIPETVKEGYEFLGWDYDFSKPISENITVKAKWKAKEYSITIDMSSLGKDNILVPVKFDSEYSLSATRKGYVLRGFTLDDAEFSMSGVWTGTKSITVIPVWNPESYKITYIIDNDNVKFEGKSSYTIEDEYVLPVLEDSAYDFLGWYNGEEKVESIKKGSMGAIKLIAKWKLKEPVIKPPKNIAIIFDADGIDIDGNTINIVLGEEYALPVPELDGYVFDAWELNGERIKISGVWKIDSDEPLTLVLRMKKESYEISYVVGDNVTNPNDQKVSYTIEDDTYELLDPTKEGYYNFIGWYTDPLFSEESKIERIEKGSFGNLVLYAKFEKEQYTVTYDPNGGSVSTTTQIVGYKDPYELLTPTRPGYQFDGWKNGEETISSGSSWDIRDNVSVIAQWTLVEYKIEYDLDGGALAENVTNPSKYDVTSATITLSNPTLKGYNFVGWQKDGSTKIEKTAKIQTGTTGDLKYTAVWEKIGVKYVYFVEENNGETVRTATLVKYTPTKEDGYMSNFTLPKTLTYNGEVYTVTKIGQEAFADLTGELAKVTLPSTLKEIGVDAFRNCDDVEIYANLPYETDVNAWTDALIIGTGNKDVADVIKGKRPKIGWTQYV